MKTYIGIDLGGTNVRALLVDENGINLDLIKEPTNAEEGVEAVMARIIRMVRSLNYAGCGGIENVSGIGMGVPGPVDPHRGCMKMAQNLPGFEDYPIKDKLYQEFKLPVYLDNDANVAGLAEALLGAGKNYKSVYFVTCSTGIGGAYIFDGHVMTGAHGYAGEVGNMIINPKGIKHGIRNAGAAETEASGTALIRLANDFMSGEEIVDAGVIFKSAEQGDPIAVRLRADFINGYSTVLANIAHVIDPECIVLGGGVMKSEKYFYDDLVNAFNDKLYPGLRGNIALLKAELPHAGSVGAAILPKSME